MLLLAVFRSLHFNRSMVVPFWQLGPVAREKTKKRKRGHAPREDNGALVAAIASGKKFSFVVDDGFHTLKSIWLTFESFRASLHESFLYVVEDIALDEIGEVKKLFKDYHIDECEADQRIIAVTPKKR